MLTDEDLTGELTLAFEQATLGMTPAPGLGGAVHGRHRSARRRAVAMRLALPAAAAAWAGSAIASGRHDASAPDAQRASTPAQHAPLSDVHAVSYTLTVPAHPTALRCVGDGVGPIAHDATTWRVALGRNDCVTLVVRTDVALPDAAHPVDLAGIAGLYETTGDGVRTIYSRNRDGHTWSALSVAARTPDAKLAGFYAPAD